VLLLLLLWATAAAPVLLLCLLFECLACQASQPINKLIN
jgi:hypothetical protein